MILQNYEVSAVQITLFMSVYILPEKGFELSASLILISQGLWLKKKSFILQILATGKQVNCSDDWFL